MGRCLGAVLQESIDGRQKLIDEGHGAGRCRWLTMRMWYMLLLAGVDRAGRQGHDAGAHGEEQRWAHPRRREEGGRAPGGGGGVVHMTGTV